MHLATLWKRHSDSEQMNIVVMYISGPVKHSGFQCGVHCFSSVYFKSSNTKIHSGFTASVYCCCVYLKPSDTLSKCAPTVYILSSPVIHLGFEQEYNVAV